MIEINPFKFLGILLIFAAFFFFLGFWKNYSAMSRLTSLTIELQDSIRYRKTVEGKLIAEKHAALLTAQEMKDQLPQLAKEIEKTFDVKIKNLNNLIAVKFAATGSGSSVINNYYSHDDSVNAKKELVFDDGFLSFSSKIDEAGMPSEYEYRDSLTIVGFEKKKLFKRTEYFVNATFENPNNKSTQLRQIRVDKFKDKRFSIGPHVGVNIDGQPTIGLSLHYDLIRLW